MSALTVPSEEASPSVRTPIDKDHAKANGACFKSKPSADINASRANHGVALDGVNGLNPTQEVLEILTRPTSAPPLLEEFEKAYGEGNSEADVKPFTDIRLDEDYEEFYKKYSGIKKLPPPVENRHLYAEVATNSPKRGVLLGQGSFFGSTPADAQKLQEDYDGPDANASMPSAKVNGEGESLAPPSEGGQGKDSTDEGNGSKGQDCAAFVQELQQQVGEQQQQGDLDQSQKQLVAQQEHLKTADAVLSVGLSRLRIRESPHAADADGSSKDSEAQGLGKVGGTGNGGVGAEPKPQVEGDSSKLISSEDKLSAPNSVVTSVAALIDPQSPSPVSLPAGEAPGPNALLAEALKGLDPAQAAAVVLLQSGSSGAPHGAPALGSAGSGPGVGGLAGWESLMAAAMGGGAQGLGSVAGPAAVGAAGATAPSAASSTAPAPLIPDLAGAGLPGAPASTLHMAAAAAAAGLPSAAGIAPSNMHLYEQLLRARLGATPGTDFLGALGGNPGTLATVPGLGNPGLVPGLEALGLSGLGASGMAGAPNQGGLDFLSAALQAARMPGALGMQGQMPGQLQGGGLDLMATAAALAALQGSAGQLDVDSATLLQFQQFQRAQQLAALQSQLQQGLLQEPQQQGDEDDTPEQAGKDLLQSAEALKALQGDNPQQQLLLQLLQQQQQLQLLNQAPGLPLGLAAAQMRTLFGGAGAEFDVGMGRMNMGMGMGMGLGLGLGMGMGGGGDMFGQGVGGVGSARGRPRDGTQNLCKFFMQSGFCARGDACPYSHSLPGTSPGGPMGLGGQSAGTPQRRGAARFGPRDALGSPGVMSSNDSWQGGAYGNRVSPPVSSNGLGFNNSQFGAASGGFQMPVVGAGRGMSPVGPGYTGFPLAGPGAMDPSMASMNVMNAYANLQNPMAQGGYGGYQGGMLDRAGVGGLASGATKYTTLAEVEGRIAAVARDQHGCRFLQRQFDEGTPEDIARIYTEIREPLMDLMVDPFGNYLVQKLLEVCSRQQQLEILATVTAREGELVNISLNMHGTRSVQKLIETVTAPEDVERLTQSLEGGVVTLIKDLNGNHVIQRCLQRLTCKQNEFIFKAAVARCVEVATHRHGCCVLQRCIDFADEGQRDRLVAEIAANTLVLAQDPFGNYVVQYILDLGLTWAVEEVAVRIRGQVAALATQKFSSNVVEKCLKVAPENSRQQIVLELITSPRLGQLLQDPFANYVIQSGLSVTKGNLYASFVDAIRPHAQALRSSPYGKRILSKTNLKPR